MLCKQYYVRTFIRSILYCGGRGGVARCLVTERHATANSLDLGHVNVILHMNCHVHVSSTESAKTSHDCMRLGEATRLSEVERPARADSQTLPVWAGDPSYLVAYKQRQHVTLIRHMTFAARLLCVASSTSYRSCQDS